MAKKPSLGRQKIKIAKIQIKNHLQVTFSKRRSGLFKKASELCTLCGVEIAIVVFSPAGKVFSFGHPNVEPIIDRFLSRNFPNSNALPTSNQASPNRNTSTVPDLNMQLTHILNDLEVEKKRGETLDCMRKTSYQQNQYWWENPINTLNLHELEQLRESMEVLKKNVTEQASRVMNDHHVANSHSFLAAAANVGNSGDGGFDHFEHKPNHIMMASSVASRVQNFGYGQGLF